MPQDDENEDVDITFVRDALPPGTCLGLTEQEQVGLFSACNFKLVFTFGLDYAILLALSGRRSNRKEKASTRIVPAPEAKEALKLRNCHGLKYR